MGVQISIIMPLFNSETTLREAAHSILTQAVEGLELLLVDDGSTDGTAAICHELACQDARVRVISQKNAGICAARNRGLSAATGRYIGFCDDDDLLLDGALPLLFHEAEKTTADIVRGGYELLQEQPDGAFQKVVHETGVNCSLQDTGYAAFLQNSGPQFVWNALYRRETLSGIWFDDRCRFGLEDFIFNMALYAKTDRVVYLSQPVYRHFERVQSTSRCQSARAMQGRIQALKFWMQAEYAAIQQRCPGDEQEQLWTLRKAEAVTFLMHQLRDAKAPTALRRHAWKTLRTVLAAYPGKPLDFLRCTGQNKKKAAALVLYQLHIPRLYDLLSGK